MSKLSTFFKDLWFMKKNLLGNLIGFIVLTFVLIQLLLWAMKTYTLHGESVEVPTLIDMKLEDAEQLLATRKLEFLVVDSICKGNSIGGLIKEQTPRPKSRVKESRKIYLTVTRHSECTVNLYYKQLIGRSRNYVTRQLERSKLKVGKLEYRPGGKAENTVVEASINGVPLFIEANPAAGERPPVDPKKVPQGSVVDLVLLEGVDALPKYIPELICSTYDAAEFTIKGSQFNLGTIHTQGEIIDTLSAWIYRQSPMPGSIATMGTGVDIWLTSEFPAGCEEEEEPILPTNETPSDTEPNVYNEEDEGI